MVNQFDLYWSQNLPLEGSVQEAEEGEKAPAVCHTVDTLATSGLL